jgi:hypothetical protein
MGEAQASRPPLALRELQSERSTVVTTREVDHTAHPGKKMVNFEQLESGGCRKIAIPLQ